MNVENDLQHLEEGTIVGFAVRYFVLNVAVMKFQAKLWVAQV